MPHTPPQLRLALSGVALAASILACQFLVKWNYRYWNKELVFMACGPALGVLGFVALTLRQQRKRQAPTSFAARQLSTTALLMSIWVVGASLLGYFVIVLGVFILPLCAAALAIAWVQPRLNDEPTTVALAIALVPLVIWFVGRADEYLREALISATAVTLILALLARLRQRGTRKLSTS